MQGSLDRYRSKRDFSVTPEPAGGARTALTPGLGFMVHMHAARRLHYDLRLEWDGVLLSWAVTKGPSADPGVKRLAVRTEDHPLDYADFEGMIPAGQYGAGGSLIWDRGEWEPLADPGRGLETGKLVFELRGERMRGRWSLVRMRPRGREKRENWLLIKGRDAHADARADGLVREHTRSVVSGRTLDEIAKGVPPATAIREEDETPASAAEPLRNPRFVRPQLATLSESPPEGENWQHEVKFDGYRCLASIGRDGVRCFTRSGKDWTDRFRRVADTLALLDCRSALLDGEMVAPADMRRSGSVFSDLQAALRNGGDPEYVVFDLLELDGRDLRASPLEERQQALDALLESLGTQQVVRRSVAVRGDGREALAAMCARGGEGLVSKRIDSPYRSGRSSTWLKSKCRKRQEFVVVGYSGSSSRGRAFASLLLATFENDRWQYRGRVGSGFGATELRRLGTLLSSLRQDAPASGLDVPASIARDARWVRPELVVEVEYTDLTAAGAVRQGVYLGTREDKAPTDIALEAAGSDAGNEASGHTTDSTDEVAGVRLTHPGRVMFPVQGASKRDLARYYLAVAERMIPLVKDHPLALVRCPKGREQDCFFQKHAARGMPAELHKVNVADEAGAREDYLYVRDAGGLVAGVQIGVLEFHLWGSRRDRLEKPARLVFDLDPDEALPFSEVRDAAYLVRAGLQELGLESLPLLTGGKGIHVVVPLRRTADWSQVRSFARGFARHLAREFPDRYTASSSRAARKRRVFVDWLRNGRGATAVAPYSTRARPGAPVATPVDWDELADLNNAAAFSMADVVERCNEPDPWAHYNDHRQSITRDHAAMFEGD